MGWTPLVQRTGSMSASGVKIQTKEGYIDVHLEDGVEPDPNIFDMFLRSLCDGVVLTWLPEGVTVSIVKRIPLP